MSHRLPFLALLATAFTLVAGSAWARCSQNVAGLERLGIQVASLEGLPFAAGNSPSRAIITFLGHSSYQIDTPQGVRAITDYNGVNGFGRKPDIVTGVATRRASTATRSSSTPSPISASPISAICIIA
jgi:hypothetical protein